MKLLRLLSLFCTIFVSVFALAFYVPQQALAASQWSFTGSLQSIAGGQVRLVTLPNGKVLAAGGNTSSGSYSDVSQLYDPSTGQWTLTGNLPVAKNQFTPALLNNGKVLVAGGAPNGGGTVSDAELYDPSTGTWSYTGSLNHNRSSAPMVKLLDGRILIISGDTHSSEAWLYTTELYDPSTGQWTYSGNVNTAIEDGNGGDVVLLTDGRVLKVGASGAFSSTTTSPVAELYDPSTGVWTRTGDLLHARYSTQLVKLQDGRVLMISGSQWYNGTTECEIYDPATGQWTQTGSTHYVREGEGAVLLPDGRVLVAGGNDNTANTLLNEIYDPSTGTWTVDASLNDGHNPTDMVLLSNGQYLVAGGYNQNGLTNTAELYSLSTLPVVQMPANTTINAGDTYSASGSFTDPDSTSWTATIDYGDGGGAHTLTLNGTNFSLSHTYTSAGQYTVIVKVTDNQGMTGTGTTTVTVNAPNTSPNVNQLNGGTINEGGTYSENGSFTDPDSTSWTATIDYGDGSGTQPLTLSGTNFSLSHVYKDNGSYTVTVSVTDNQGATGTGTATITVNNVAPTVGAITAPSSPVLINTAITASANFTDPGVLDTHNNSGTHWNWGDGNTTTATVTESNGSGSVSNSHTYTATGVYTITLTVTDKDGGQGTATFQYVAVYDSSTSFAGGRSFDNPSSASPSTSGKVSFGISAKYNNSNVLTGNAKMDFKAASLDFASTSLSSLATSNGRAYLKGSGTLNGNSGYTFLATGIDGSVAGGNDLIRFQIIDSSNTVVYDSQPGAGDTTDPTTTDATGNIRVH